MDHRIVCYGDSNTYGYDPQSPLGGRYLPQARWPEQLTELRPGREVWNLGENGREIPRRPWELQRLEEGLKRAAPVDGIVVMLGSNDLLQMSPPRAALAAERMGALLAWLLLAPILSDFLMGVLFAIVAGIMLYISFEELVPSSRQYGYNSVALWSLFAGVCIMPISLAI